MKKIFSVCILLVIAVSTKAQTRFFNTIHVEFEKTINVHAYYKELEPEWFDQIKSQLPQTVINYYDFIGDQAKSIYKPGREGTVTKRGWYRPVADQNVIYTDFKTGMAISQKPVFEETFLVEDSLLNIEWRITSDMRMIAGYNCRKAVGILNDTIAIFAFYSDELLVNGGPESIQGLPGMILGVGIPRLHATWFATKVEVYDVNMNAVTPATKGKKVDRKTMVEAIDKVLKTWGTYGSKMIINFLI
ncbi:MAG TPA: GLPGLI family protein [Chitinophagaceae bacterium]|jgi:Protein of unknown function (Porph_ging).